MSDHYEFWRRLLAGENPPIHSDDYQCGYFKVRDRRGVNARLAPAKRPFVPAAIWKDGDKFRAEIAGTEIDVEQAWPWIAKHAISHEQYVYWHNHERWPS